MDDILLNLVSLQLQSPKSLCNGLGKKYLRHYLTYQFDVAVRAFSSRSQMASKYVVGTKRWHARRQQSVSLIGTF